MLDYRLCQICKRRLTPGHQCYALPFDTNSEAFEGLAEETLDAIRAAVTPEQVQAFVGTLSPVPQHATPVLQALQRLPWWKRTSSRDSQLRRVRVLRDAAVAFGFPVCSTNAGYALGNWDDVYKSARRAKRFAQGAYLRALTLEKLAEKMPR